MFLFLSSLWSVDSFLGESIDPCNKRHQRSSQPVDALTREAAPKNTITISQVKTCTRSVLGRSNLPFPEYLHFPLQVTWYLFTTRGELAIIMATVDWRLGRLPTSTRLSPISIEVTKQIPYRIKEWAKKHRNICSHGHPERCTLRAVRRERGSCSCSCSCPKEEQFMTK